MISVYTHANVYSIQSYVIKFVSELWLVGSFLSLGTTICSINKTVHHNIAEISLKVVIEIDNPSSIHRWVQCIGQILKIIEGLESFPPLIVYQGLLS